MNRMGIAVLLTVNFLCVLAGFAFAVTWANVYDAPNSGYGASDIRPTPDGGFIVAGTVWSGSSDVSVMKLTSTGTVSWQYRYGGAGEIKHF